MNRLKSITALIVLITLMGCVSGAPVERAGGESVSVIIADAWENKTIELAHAGFLRGIDQTSEKFGEAAGKGGAAANMA